MVVWFRVENFGSARESVMVSFGESFWVSLRA